MTLSKTDIKQIAEIFTELSKMSHSVDLKDADKVQINSVPKRVLSASERPVLLSNLTQKQVSELVPEINKNNLFAGRYKAARTFYKTQNVEGRPNIRYSEYFEPRAKSLKYSSKQLGELKVLATKQLADKVAKQNHPKATEWLNKSIEEIKSFKL